MQSYCCRRKKSNRQWAAHHVEPGVATEIKLLGNGFRDTYTYLPTFEQEVGVK